MKREERLELIRSSQGMNFIGINGTPGDPLLHIASGLLGGYGSWVLFFIVPSVASTLLCCCLYVARYGGWGDE